MYEDKIEEKVAFLAFMELEKPYVRIDSLTIRQTLEI